MDPFYYHNQQLMCEGVSLTAIAAAVGTPVYVYSQGELLARAKAYQTAVPHSHVCYAVKANGNPHLLRRLGLAGLGADVTSGGELFLALHAGIAADKIIFSGVGKTQAEIEAALAAGIRALHIESAMELTAVGSIASRRQQVARVGIRVNPNISAETHPYISTGQHSHKFGVPLAQALALFRLAADHPWLEPVGLAAHIGSQIRDIAPFVEAAHFLVAMARQLGEEGIGLDYIDVGGGLGIDYTNEGVPQVGDWATAVAHPIQQAGFKLVMEPGRSLVGPTGALLIQVVYTKTQGEKQFVITDTGMNDLLRPTLYQAYHPILPLREQTSGELTAVDVVGPICESGDWLAKERPLPPQQPGDRLAILQAGAYGFAMGSNYNGRLRPAEVLVNGSQFQIIRRRQQHQQLLDGCAPLDI